MRKIRHDILRQVYRFLSFLCVVTLLLGTTDSIHAHDGGEHKIDIAYILFNSPDGKTVAKENKEALDLISKAVQFAIDEDGSHYDNSTYPAFVSDVGKKDPVIAANMKAYPEAFPKIGGGRGKHREYCHQGFYYPYEGTVEYEDRWYNAREDILIPTIALAFGLDNQDTEDRSKAEIIAVIAYYSHIIGDMDGDLSYMDNFKNMDDVLLQFSSDIKEALRKCPDESIKNYYVLDVQGIPDIKGARTYMQKNFYRLVAQITGMPYEEPSPVETLVDWIQNAA